MNYAVIIPGHVSFFDDYYDALMFALDCDTFVYNLWGFRQP